MKFLFLNSAPIISFGMAKGFEQAGQTVRVINSTAEHQRDKNFLFDLIADYKPDFAFTEGGDSLQNILFPALHTMNVEHIYWAIEDPPDYERLSLPYARNSKFVFTPCEECISWYAGQGIEAGLLNFACLPEFHKKVPREEAYSHDIIFVGNNYNRHTCRVIGREIVLIPVIEHGYDVKIYGNDWWLNPFFGYTLEEKHYGGYLAYENLPAAYSSSKIVLGMHSVDSSKTMMSMRTFEVLGCGAFYLTQWTPAIENLFENHKHLVWTKSAQETVALVDYYLSHDKEREEIARQGQEFVYQNHTYLHRADVVLQMVQNRQKGVVL